MFLFDQTCACVAKPIPLAWSSVIFHYDLKKHHSYTIGYPLIQGWTVDASLARRTNEASHWPQDFSIIQTKQFAGPGWLNLTAKPDADERYYVFLTALRGSPTFPDPSTYVEISGILEDHGKGKSPGFDTVLMALAVAITTFVALHRKRTM
jgi:hypothetical protein